MSRHPELSPRTPEATSATRVHGFNKEAVNKFVNILQVVQNTKLRTSHVCTLTGIVITTFYNDSGFKKRVK